MARPPRTGQEIQARLIEIFGGRVQLHPDQEHWSVRQTVSCKCHNCGKQFRQRCEGLLRGARTRCGCNTTEKWRRLVPEWELLDYPSWPYERGDDGIWRHTGSGDE